MNVLEGLRDCGFEFTADKENRKAKLRGTLAAVLRFAHKYEDYTWENDHNRQESERVMKREGEDDWVGGSLAELNDWLAGRKDLAPQHEEKKKLSKYGVERKVMAKSAQILPRRRRELSEYDGELEMDRVEDVKPFNHARRRNTGQKVIEVNCGFSVNCGTDASELDKYGALIWAISDILEKAGLFTRVIMRMDVKSIGNGPSIDIDNEFEIKKPGEYIMPQLLAASFTTNFFRRIGFLIYVAGCEAYGIEADSGLGHSETPRETMEFKEGHLRITTRLINQGDRKFEMLEEEVIKAIESRASSHNKVADDNSAALAKAIEKRRERLREEDEEEEGPSRSCGTSCAYHHFSSDRSPCDKCDRASHWESAELDSSELSYSQCVGCSYQGEDEDFSTCCDCVNGDEYC